MILVVSGVQTTEDEGTVFHQNGWNQLPCDRCHVTEEQSSIPYTSVSQTFFKWGPLLSVRMFYGPLLLVRMFYGPPYSCPL
jgi:hypothetical protein